MSYVCQSSRTNPPKTMFVEYKQNENQHQSTPEICSGNLNIFLNEMETVKNSSMFQPQATSFSDSKITPLYPSLNFNMVKSSVTSTTRTVCTNEQFLPSCVAQNQSATMKENTKNEFTSWVQNFTQAVTKLERLVAETTDENVLQTAAIEVTQGYKVIQLFKPTTGGDDDYKAIIKQIVAAKMLVFKATRTSTLEFEKQPLPEYINGCRVPKTSKPELPNASNEVAETNRDDPPNKQALKIAPKITPKLPENMAKVAEQFKNIDENTSEQTPPLHAVFMQAETQKTNDTPNAFNTVPKTSEPKFLNKLMSHSTPPAPGNLAPMLKTVDLKPIAASTETLTIIVSKNSSPQKPNSLKPASEYRISPNLPENIAETTNEPVPIHLNVFTPEQYEHSSFQHQNTRDDPPDKALNITPKKRQSESCRSPICRIQCRGQLREFELHRTLIRQMQRCHQEAPLQTSREATDEITLPEVPPENRIVFVADPPKGKAAHLPPEDTSDEILFIKRLPRIFSYISCTLSRYILFVT